MKTAICLYGIIGGTSGKDSRGRNIPFEECYKTYKKHLIDVNDADVFIHSWSIEVEKELVNLCKPKKHQFQKQIDFHMRNSANIHRSRSRWYSTKRVLELKKEYEREHNFIYDCVMVVRMDLLFFTDFDFSKFDLKYFYASNWNIPDRMPKHPDVEASRTNNSLKVDGFLDIWFFSNSKMMDEFTKIYDGVTCNKYRFSQHYSAWDCLMDNGYSRNDLKYAFYRHFDYELYRFYVLRNFFAEGDGK